MDHDCEVCENRDTCPVIQIKEQVEPFITKTLEAKGYRVLRNTQYCEQRTSCKGCEGEEGCRESQLAFSAVIEAFEKGIPPEISAIVTKIILEEE